MLSQVDDPQEGTNDAPVMTAPTSEDGANQNTHNSPVRCHMHYLI